MANILPVPESEQRVLDNLIRDLNETYPDKVIVRLQQDHKKWYEKVTRLYKNIGYASRDEFLAAYGFTEAELDKIERFLRNNAVSIWDMAREGNHAESIA